MSVKRPAQETKIDTRAGAAFNNSPKRSQEQDSMDGYFNDEELADATDDFDEEALNEEAPNKEFGASSKHGGSEESTNTLNDAPFEDDDDELMTIVDPMIDKAAQDSDDSEDVEDSDLDDDTQFDQLDEFMSEDDEEPDDITALSAESDVDLDMDIDGLDALDAELDEELEKELKVPLTASQQALEARRAIEERAEARRMERDLNYLDFELDD